MINENFKVSIITVAYNAASTIEQTIQSVLNQTYKNIEYIIIDGASTDGTQQIIEKYEDVVAYYDSEKDEGLYYAMNKGIEKATGDIIGIINSDDWYTVDAVQSVVECFKRNEPDLVYGRIDWILSDSSKKIYKNVPLDEMWYRMSVPHPSVFIKKDIYEKYGNFDVRYKYSSDYELMLRLYSNNLVFKYIDKVIAYFREGGIAQKNRLESYAEGYKISMAYVDMCPCKDKVLICIQKIYEDACFVDAVINIDRFLYKQICSYFDEIDVRNIFIFGTGIWSERCYNALLRADIRVVAFVDNNPAKWNTKFYGIDVINPAELRNRDEYVLIAVKEHGEEIKEQLSNLRNDRLHCVTINELRDMYCAKHFK